MVVKCPCLLIFHVGFIPILIRSFCPFCASSFVQLESPRATIASVIYDVSLDILEVVTNTVSGTHESTQVETYQNPPFYFILIPIGINHVSIFIQHYDLVTKTSKFQSIISKAPAGNVCTYASTTFIGMMSTVEELEDLEGLEVADLLCVIRRCDDKKRS